MSFASRDDLLNDELLIVKNDLKEIFNKEMEFPKEYVDWFEQVHSNFRLSVRKGLRPLGPTLPIIKK